MIYQKTGDTVRALDAYLQAIESIPIPDCFYRAAQFLNDKKDYLKLLEISTKCKEDSPYDTIVIFYQALALISLNQKRKAYEILNCHRRALNSFKGIRKNTIIRYSISLILILVSLNNSFGSAALAELTKKLRKRIGAVYIS
jgi:tetratricopeptide (TPR) repeat protein